MEFYNLILKKEKKTAIIIVNRPNKMNTLNIGVLKELKIALRALEKDRSVHCVIITGFGDKSFISGADISELNALNKKTAKKFALNGQEILERIENFTKPVIAAVNGYALGGGCELALACHIRYASENAKFSQPEINLGIIPGFGGTQRLTRLVSHGKALEMILTGEMIDADEAYKIGLVNKVFKKSELIPKAIEIADNISLKGQLAVKAIIEATNICKKNIVKEGFALEAELFSNICETEDAKEGIQAFLQKRNPTFRNV